MAKLAFPPPRLWLELIEKKHQAGDFVFFQGWRCDFQVPRPLVHAITGEPVDRRVAIAKAY